jgi:hypothetical protein
VEDENVGKVVGSFGLRVDEFGTGRDTHVDFGCPELTCGFVVEVSGPGYSFNVHNGVVSTLVGILISIDQIIIDRLVSLPPHQNLVNI